VSTTALHAIALLACALVAMPADAAPSPEALATKAFLARQKEARTAFRAALKSAETEAALALRGVETAIASGGSLSDAGEATFGTLFEFQSAVQAAGGAAAVAQFDAARDALLTLGSPLDGQFPEHFYWSDGEPATLFQEGLAADLAKSYVRIRKRVGRIRARFEGADFGFCFRIRAPHAIDQLAWQENIAAASLGFQPTLDLVVAWSARATLADGQIRAGGSASLDPIDVVADDGIGLASANDVMPFEERFATDFGGGPFSEGNWLVMAGINGERSELAIGVP
jgi:hypothetical protein